MKSEYFENKKNGFKKMTKILYISETYCGVTATKTKLPLLQKLHYNFSFIFCADIGMYDFHNQKRYNKKRTAQVRSEDMISNPHRDGITEGIGMVDYNQQVACRFLIGTV